MQEITIRCEGGDSLTIRVWGSSYPGASDYWEGHWLSASVEVRAGGFYGSVGGTIWAGELAAFHAEFAPLQESLRGSAELRTMEDWLSIRVETDGRGHMAFWCAVRDQPGGANRLLCCLETDQTFTRTTVAELAAVVAAFPVVNRPV